MEVQVLKIFLALVVLVNPSAALSIFIDITKDATRNQARKVAFISALTVFLTIAIFTIAGEGILRVLGISLGSFRIAGGLLVLLIAIQMMNGNANPVKPQANDENLKTTKFNATASAIVPLTIPMCIGPGGISTVIIYAANSPTMTNTVALILAGFIISFMNYMIFMAANQVSRFLGETGIKVLNRVMGLLLAAVGVEIMVAGLRETFKILA